MTDYAAVQSALVDALGSDAVIVDPDRMDRYRRDESTWIAAGVPVAVVRPADTAGVQAAVRVAAAHGVPIITRGAGTSLAAGSTAQDGAITLSTDRMRALTIDPASRTAVVGPGLLNAEVK
ncbi:MAG: FAD-binding protein, partial [Microbacterium sp.]